MPYPKHWPESDSEYVMSLPEAMEAAELAACGRPVAELAAATIQSHNIAVMAHVELRAVAERYYTAAGFRE